MLALFLLTYLVFVGFGVYKTRQVEHSPLHLKFRSGKAPEPAPDGFLKGDVHLGIGHDWQGKVFDRDQKTGINRFSNGQRYTFNTYQAPGLRDKQTQVLRIDYNRGDNPLWLRFIADEIVETSPGHYLGKIHLKVPGFTFTLGYFELSTP